MQACLLVPRMRSGPTSRGQSLMMECSDLISARSSFFVLSCGALRTVRCMHDNKALSIPHSCQALRLRVAKAVSANAALMNERSKSVGRCRRHIYKPFVEDL